MSAETWIHNRWHRCHQVPGLSMVQKGVLVAISCHSDEEWCAFPSETTLAEYAGCSDRAVRDAVKVLVERGVITATKRPGYNTAYQIVETNLPERRQARMPPQGAPDTTPRNHLPDPPEPPSRGVPADPPEPGSVPPGTTFRTPRNPVPDPPEPGSGEGTNKAPVEGTKEGTKGASAPPVAPPPPLFLVPPPEPEPAPVFSWVPPKHLRQGHPPEAIAQMVLDVLAQIRAPAEATIAATPVPVRNGETCRTDAAVVLSLWRDDGCRPPAEFAADLVLVARAARWCPEPMFARDIRAEGWPGGTDRRRSVGSVCRHRPKADSTGATWGDRLEAAKRWAEAGYPTTPLKPSSTGADRGVYRVDMTHELAPRDGGGTDDDVANW